MNIIRWCFRKFRALLYLSYIYAEHIIFLAAFHLCRSNKIKRLWQSSTIKQIDKAGVIVNCYYCASKNYQFFYKSPLEGDFAGLYDKDSKRLDYIYGMNINNLKKRNLYFSKAKRILEKNTIINYMKCNDCGLIYQNYPHDERTINNYYNNLYRSMSADTESNFGRGTDAIFVERKNLIVQYFLNRTSLPLSSKILDIGCAEGILCNCLKKAGMVPYGIDPCLPEVKYAKEYYKLENIVPGNYEMKSYPEASFDGIISHHVLEHIFNVKDVFNAICYHLKSNGYLLIQCPNINDEIEYQQRALRRLHLVGYTREFLARNLCDRFEILEILETPAESSQDFPWLHLGRAVSKWGGLPCSLSILARRK